MSSEKQERQNIEKRIWHLPLDPPHPTLLSPPRHSKLFPSIIYSALALRTSIPAFPLLPMFSPFFFRNIPGHTSSSTSWGISCQGTAAIFGVILNRRGVRQTTTPVRALEYSDMRICKCRASRSPGASLHFASTGNQRSSVTTTQSTSGPSGSRQNLSPTLSLAFALCYFVPEVKVFKSERVKE